uniref:flagellin N-terminal helical domain-containing protein n=1 Tax=Agathobacter sp. TaxID=2021311 RepID=UPI0040577577
MIVQHNLQAMNANRMLGTTKKSQAKATEKLSSGYRINRAADDAAGLAISEKMRKQIRGLDQASTNAQDGISAVQTAEGALSEVHSMLQRMNELAVQAANGTNSESDREAIQDEIEQLTIEIDRVAETTKFNETYMLKGNGKTSTAQISAKDAGITGKLVGVGTGTATFTMTALKAGETISIGAKGYTIGTTIAGVQDALEAYVTEIQSKQLSSVVTINGTDYILLSSGGTTKVDDREFTVDDLKNIIRDGDKVTVGTQIFVAMTDGENGSAADGVADNDGSVISAKKAYELIQDELRKASAVGADVGDKYQPKVEAAKDVATDNTPTTGYYSANCTQISFTITEGKVVIKQGLQMGIHVGADADGTNKIAFTIDAMDAAGLGIKGLNVLDSTGAKATYALDSIAEAITKVSQQRSTLGAIQNRLEHTIANLDNVVENTTSAESTIRDADMAETMVEYSKNNILQQAGQAMLAQANQSTSGVLSLLQ